MVWPMHVDLRERKTLAAKFTFWRVQHLLRSAFEDQNCVHLLDDLEVDIVRNLESDLISNRISANSEHLDIFLSTFFEKLETIAKVKFDRSFLDNVRDMFATAFLIRQSVACEACVDFFGGTPKLICEGNESDHRTVTLGGFCMDPLREMFKSVVSLATFYYREYATQGDAINDPELKFSTRSTGESPHRMPIELFVGGETSYKHDGGAWETQVQLILWASRFDRKSYFACFYTLAHEIIVHGFAGLEDLMRGRSRETPSDDDPFAEGWMDFLVDQTLEHAFRHNRLPRDSIADASEFRDTAALVHLARTDLSKCLNHPNTSDYTSGIVGNRIKGKKAAQKASALMRLASPKCPLPNRARNLFRLSFDLNLRKLPATDREKFVSTLCRCPEELLAPRGRNGFGPSPAQFLLLRGLMPPFAAYVQNETGVEELFSAILRI